NLREEAARLEAQAVFLYGHYAVFDELLRAVREGRPPPEHAQIKALDRKAHTITLAVGDVDAITLDYEKEVTANAHASYASGKEHLKEGDRYAHADIHGAPSTVIKDGARSPETTLREACEFALAYSKAWSAGLASGSAYWVLPEQVSKQAESGEFLPRGAFVVRGKRNYLHDLPVQLAIGEVEIEGHRKIMGGPVAAVAARSKRY